MTPTSFVELTLESNSELKPFVPCWETITSTFKGLDEQAPSHNFNIQAQAEQFIRSQLAKTGDVTEEQFLFFLVNLEILKADVVCTKSYKVWDPLHETFASFQRNHPTVSVSLSEAPAKVKTYYNWIMSLCDWEISSGESKRTYH
ncbi:hypothetical protein KW507_15975 [Vibrio fluvialis]|nr:hypothetical protein [Vibrio fluvialis]